MFDERDPQLIAAVYKSLYRIRRIEEEIIRLYPTDKIKSPVHLSIGQEPISVGVCAALLTSDIVFGTYRGHALYLAKGGDPKAMFAELYGKRDGESRGKGGSMHLADFSVGMMGTSAIVATTIPQAVGYALAAKMRRERTVVAVFFGDGAMDEGVFHESVNFASLKKLPVLFVCENNDYAIYSHVRARMPEPNLRERASAYRMETDCVEDGDIFEILEKSRAAVASIRAGGGPRLLECKTCRWRDHVGPDEDRVWGYRPDKELDSWIDRDQVARLAGMIVADSRADIEADIEAEIEAAIEFAEQSRFPGDEELLHHVFHE